MWHAALQEDSICGTLRGQCPDLCIDIEGKRPKTFGAVENCSTKTSFKTRSDEITLSCSYSCPSCIGPLPRSCRIANFRVTLVKLAHGSPETAA